MERKTHDCDHCKKEIKGIRHIMPEIMLGPETPESRTRFVGFENDSEKDFCSPGCLIGYFQQQVNGGS